MQQCTRGASGEVFHAALWWPQSPVQVAFAVPTTPDRSASGAPRFARSSASARSVLARSSGVSPYTMKASPAPSEIRSIVEGGETRGLLVVADLAALVEAMRANAAHVRYRDAVKVATHYFGEPRQRRHLPDLHHDERRELRDGSDDPRVRGFFNRTSSEPQETP